MNEDLINRTLDALDRLMRMFQLERILFLVTAFVSFLLLIYAGYRLFSTGEVDRQDIVIIFGASSASTAASARVAFFLNRSFNLVEYLIKALAGGGVGGPASVTAGAAAAQAVGAPATTGAGAGEPA